MPALLKSAKLIAVVMALGWAGFAVYLGSISNSDRIQVLDAVVRANSPVSKSAAVYFLVRNGTEFDDRLLAVSTDAAHTSMLHRNVELENGVMQMLHVGQGFPVSAGSNLALEPGQSHVMLMGLTKNLKDGEKVTLVLTFETAGEITLSVPVRLGR